MEPRDWNDDDQPAPLPPHERNWRHPSEVGEQVWRTTEPPLTIGRGLTFATGTIGCVLALVVVLTMMPTGAGRSAVITVRSTMFATADRGSASTSTAAMPTSPLRSEQASTASTTAAVTSDPESVPPTVHLHTTADENWPIVAVPVHHGRLLVSTARAVAQRPAVAVQFADGTTTIADVVFVDQRSGLAVLAPSDRPSTRSFVVARDVAPGDHLIVAGDAHWTMTVDAAGSVADQWAALTEAVGNDLAEGAPVVNDRGELVAVCTHGADGQPRMVGLAALDVIGQAISGIDNAPAAWLGVVINDDPSGVLAIGAVDPTGPAALAGAHVGDVVVALDGQPLTDRRSLVAHLSVHEPGDTVQVSVRRTGGVLVELHVVLAPPPTPI